MENKLNKSMFFWNFVGSSFNSVASFLLLLASTRAIGAEMAGIFAFAFSFAQLMLTIGRYGMRSYQVTDINEKISTNTYISSRVATCILMILTAVLIIMFFEYSLNKSIVVILVCFIKMCDAIEDVFHGVLQIKGKLDVAGKLLTIRNLFTIIIYTMCIFIYKDLILTCTLTAFFSIILCLGINICVTKKYLNFTLIFNKKELINLAKDCFPLFLASFLSIYIYNCPRYSIDKLLSDTLQTYYSIIFMPIFVINLFSEFIFKPILTPMADFWQKDLKKFKRSIFSMFGVILFLAVMALLFGYFFAIPILSWIYNLDLSSCKEILMLLLIGGSVGASVYFLFNILTLIRKQKIVLFAYGASAFISTLISNFLIERFELYGAATVYFIAEVLIFIIYLSTLIIEIKNKK